MSMLNAVTDMATVGMRIGDWPYRSTRREIWGAARALVKANVAETAPASQ